MFLFTDNQIADERWPSAVRVRIFPVDIHHGRFFVFFNDLLSSGEITDLYPSEDYE